MNDDENRIRKLHADFVEANRVGDVSFLRAHMAPGEDALCWFNLNQSNYLGVDHICVLWDMLRNLSAGGRAECTVREERITVSGDAAWIIYALDFRADFGANGKVVQDARCTEIWQRQTGDWRMVHFHCSNHVPGQMGGL